MCLLNFFSHCVAPILTTSVFEQAVEGIFGYKMSTILGGISDMSLIDP